MEIYVKLSQQVDIIAKQEIVIKDIAKIEGDEALINKIGKMKVLTIPSDCECNYLVTLLDIIKLIKNQYKDLVIYNIGQDETIISFCKEKKQEKPLIVFGKVLSVCLILLCGGAIAIMTFHTDAAVPDVFTEFYILFLGNDDLKPYIIEIPYSIGITVGIVTFYNHFSKITLTKDPSPIEVEITKYNQDVMNTIREKLDKKEGG
jgi:stage V sporulation protein AA